MPMGNGFEEFPQVQPTEIRVSANGKQGKVTKKKSLSPEGAAVKEKEQSVKILKKIQSKPKFDVVAKPALQ